jgi:hypothetical protein
MKKNTYSIFSPQNNLKTPKMTRKKIKDSGTPNMKVKNFQSSQEER